MNEIVLSKKRGSGQRQLVRYSPELMAVICERISLGESLRAIWRSPTRTWTARRILPKEYGEHVAVKGDTAGGGLNIRIDLS